MRLSEHRYRTVKSASGPLLFLDNIFEAKIGEQVEVIYPDGRHSGAEVLEIHKDTVLVEVYGDTRGLDTAKTEVVFLDSVKTAPLSKDVIGRVFNGSFNPIDGQEMFIPQERRLVTGRAINPSARATPTEFIETGFSSIDGLNTLIKGQKLPVFTGPGLPSKEVASDILKNSRLSGGGDFVVVFVALGVAFRDYDFYMGILNVMKTGFTAFINLAEEPVMERLIAPRFALTVSEYLAFDCGMDVLVLITDMLNYCDALREVSTAREELPGRRGYPGHMYSDLASIYERAGRIKGTEGSITMIPVVTMPEDDITHPVPDLTGYITEGQIILSRDLHHSGVYPPVDVLPSLSRLMRRGIGSGFTREDHKKVSDLLYRHYARGRDVGRLEAIVGRDGLSTEDKNQLDFASSFEGGFINQKGRRTIQDTLDAGWDVIRKFNLQDA